MPQSDKLLKHAVIIALPQVFNLIYKLFMVNRLPVDYSQLGAFMATIAIIATPLSALTAWASYKTSRLMVAGDAAGVRKFARTSVRTFFLTGIAAAGVVFALGLLVRGSLTPSDPVLSEIFSGCVVFVVVSPLFYGLLQGRQRYGWLALYVLSFTLGKLVMGSIFTMAGLDVQGAALGILSAYVLGAIMALLALSRINRDVADRRAVSAAPPPAELGYLGLSAVALSAMSLIFFSDEVLVRLMNTAQADSFSAAKIVGSIFIYAPLPLIAAMFPKVSERHYRGESTLPLLWKCLGLAVAGLAVGLAAWWLLAPTVAPLFLGGRHYSGVAHMSRAYCLAIAPYALANILAQFSVACGRWRFLAVLGPASIIHVVLVFAFSASVWNVITAVGVFGLVVLALVSLVVLTDKKFARR